MQAIDWCIFLMSMFIFIAVSTQLDRSPVVRSTEKSPYLPRSYLTRSRLFMTKYYRMNLDVSQYIYFISKWPAIGDSPGASTGFSRRLYRTDIELSILVTVGCPWNRGNSRQETPTPKRIHTDIINIECHGISLNRKQTCRRESTITTYLARVICVCTSLF